MECASRVSLSLDSSEVLVGVFESLVNASSTAAMCFDGISVDCMFPTVPTSLSGSSDVAIRALGEPAWLEFTLEVDTSCGNPDRGAWDSLSSSGGQVVCAFLGSTEIAVGGETSRVSSLGVGMVYKEKVQ